MHKINFKNILVGLGSAVIILTSLYVGLFSDASSLGLKSTSTNLSSDNKGDGSEYTTIKIIKEVEPGSILENKYPFTISLLNDFKPVVTLTLWDNDLQDPALGGGMGAKYGTPYTIEEVGTDDPRGLDSFATSYICEISSNITQTSRVLEGLGRKIPEFVLNKGEDMTCTFTNNSDPSITAFTDDSTPYTSIVYDEQTVDVGTYKFSAVKDSFAVNDIFLNIADATVATEIQLYDGASIIARAPAGRKQIVIAGFSFKVPANTSKLLKVKLVLGKVGYSAGVSGSSQLITLTDFNATNLSSGINKPGLESNPALSQIYAYASIPRVSSRDLPSTKLIIGTQEIYKFVIDSFGGELNWKEVVFDIRRQIDGYDTLSEPVLLDDNGVQIPGTFTFYSYNSFRVEEDDGRKGQLVFIATDEQKIIGRGNNTYHLKMKITGSLVAGNYLSTDIRAYSNYKIPDTYSNVSNTSATFVWSDLSAAGHSVTTSDWNNPYLVPLGGTQQLFY